VRSGIIIAIDGYSSCGKSTLATDLAAALQYVHVDSGAMYRAVTLYFIQEGVSLEKESEIQEALDHIHIGFSHHDGNQTTLLNGENVDEQIRSADVNKLVSPVAAISSIRRAMVRQQRALGALGGIVMDGRDIGSVVFPNAELKIFLTAEIPVRVERRYTELTGFGVSVSRAEVAESLAYRDRIDTTREDSPLVQADDAILIDNTYLTREMQFQKALALAYAAISRTTISD